MCVPPNIHTCMHAYIHQYIHTYMHTYMHTYTHIHIHIHIHTLIHTYTHIHTYIHTYIQRPTIYLGSSKIISYVYIYIYITTHSTHFIYGYMASDIWLRTILIVRKETRCRHIGYSYRLTARVLLYAPSNRHYNTYHVLCYTSGGALAGTRNSSMGPIHEGSIRRPTAP